MAVKSQATQEQPEASPEASAPINFAEPDSPATPVEVQVSKDKPADFVDPDPVSAREAAKLQAQAEREQQKREFFEKVMAARQKDAPKDPAPPPPIPDRIRAQIEAEKAAGRKAVAHHESLAVKRVPPPPVKSDAVFRPADYVPDQRKGQGYVQARTLSG